MIFNLQEKWKEEWQENIPTGRDLVEDSTNPQPSFHSQENNGQQPTESKHSMAEQPQTCINSAIGICPHAQNATRLYKTWTIQYSTTQAHLYQEDMQPSTRQK